MVATVAVVGITARKNLHIESLQRFHRSDLYPFEKLVFGWVTEVESQVRVPRD